MNPQPLTRLFNTCLLRPADFRPTQSDLEVIGTFNPGAAMTEQGVVLLVRVAEQAAERRKDYTAFPRWDLQTNKVALDWHHNDNLDQVDIRVVKHRHNDLVRLTFISHLRIIRSRDGRKIDSIDEVTFGPATIYEEFGVEDPRITRIGDTFYITYVAVSRHGVATALASTRDFKTFERHGILFSPENKDVVLFPEKIGGHYYALHRPVSATRFTQPEMWLARSPDLEHWGGIEYFLGGSGRWDIGRIGAGPPPIRMVDGWLEIYHGNSRSEEDTGIGVYSAGALLLDLENPRRILRARGQIFVPETDYEVHGFVPNVFFPSGLVVNGGKALLYYGAADTCAAVVEFSLDDLLHTMKETP